MRIISYHKLTDKLATGIAANNLYLEFISAKYLCHHRRRLVINIGGGAKKFGKN